MENTSKNFSILICIETAIACVLAVFKTIGSSGLISMLFAGSFLLVVAYIVFNYKKVSIRIDVLLLIVLCFFNIVLGALLEYGTISFNYLKKAIMFLVFIILLNFVNNESFNLTKSEYYLISLLPIAVGIYMVISYYILGNRVALNETAITLGFENPNFTGMWLFHFLLYGILFVIGTFKENKLCVLIIPFLVMIFILLWKTETRSCIIGLVFFFLLLLIGIFKKRWNKLFLIFIAVFPLLYAIIYMNIINTDFIQEKFAFMVSEGKSLTSRVEIWQYAFDHYKQHPIIGSYYGVSGGHGLSQMHNTHVDVLTSYGILPFVLFVNNLYSNMKSINQQIMSYYQYACFSAFCSVVIVGSFEAAVVAGSMGLNLLTVGFFTLTFYKSNGFQRH